jgi:succinate dehydrogenase/fumarate reductase flavoprotein subunit
MVLEGQGDDPRDGRRGPIFAASTSVITTGDGLGMAACRRAARGPRVLAIHPTGVAGAGVLITEGVRGGAASC